MGVAIVAAVTVALTLINGGAWASMGLMILLSAVLFYARPVFRAVW